jgi:hypothetical protein
MGIYGEKTSMPTELNLLDIENNIESLIKRRQDNVDAIRALQYENEHLTFTINLYKDKKQQLQRGSKP